MKYVLLAWVVLEENGEIHNEQRANELRGNQKQFHHKSPFREFLKRHKETFEEIREAHVKKREKELNLEETYGLQMIASLPNSAQMTAFFVRHGSQQLKKKHWLCAICRNSHVKEENTQQSGLAKIFNAHAVPQ